MSLRLQEQCLRSNIKSVARVAQVLLLQPISGNMDVNTLACKHSELLGNAAIVRKRSVIHKVDLCVFAAIYTETQERKVDLWPPLGKFVKEKDRERYGDRKTNIERKRRVKEHKRKMQATEREGIESSHKQR